MTTSRISNLDAVIEKPNKDNSHIGFGIDSKSHKHTGSSNVFISQNTSQQVIIDLAVTHQKALDKIESLEKYIEINEKTIERIIGMCGHPDAAEGCRNILKLIKENKQ